VFRSGPLLIDRPRQNLADLQLLQPRREKCQRLQAEIELQ